MQREIEAWGFGEQHRHRRASARPPAASRPREWLMDFSIDLNGDTERGPGGGHVDRRRERQHHGRPGRRPGHPAPAGPGLRHARQRGDDLASAAGAPGRPTTAPSPTSTRSSPSPRARSTCRPEWRDPLIAGLDGVTKAGGGTATRPSPGFDQSAVPGGGQDGHGPGERQERLVAVRRLRPHAHRGPRVGHRHGHRLPGGRLRCRRRRAAHPAGARALRLHGLRHRRLRRGRQPFTAPPVLVDAADVRAPATPRCATVVAAVTGVTRGRLRADATIGAGGIEGSIESEVDGRRLRRPR